MVKQEFRVVDAPDMEKLEKRVNEVVEIENANGFQLKNFNITKTKMIYFVAMLFEK